MKSVIKFVFILVVFVQGFTSLNVIYMKSKTGQSANDFILKTTTTFSKGECVLTCIQETECLSVEYWDTTGSCVCHSAFPEALTLISTPNGSVYFTPQRTDYIPTACQAAAPAGYIYSKDSHLCYKVHTDKMTWVDAQAICEDERGLLVKVDTSAKRQLVNAIVSEDGTIDYYLGATDSAEDGVWRWLGDNSLISGFSKSGSKECLEIGSEDLALDDSGCNNMEQRFICEIVLPY